MHIFGTTWQFYQVRLQNFRVTDNLTDSQILCSGRNTCMLNQLVNKVWMLGIFRINIIFSYFYLLLCCRWCWSTWWPWICSSQKFLQVRGLAFFWSMQPIVWRFAKLSLNRECGGGGGNYVLRVSWNAMELRLGDPSRIYYYFMCFTPRILSYRLSMHIFRKQVTKHSCAGYSSTYLPTFVLVYKLSYDFLIKMVN